MSDSFIEALVSRQGASAETARRCAELVASSTPEVQEAAAKWVETGRYPTQPEIAGQSAATLGVRLRPTQVFSALVALATDAAAALHILDGYGRQAPTTASAEGSLPLEAQGHEND